MRLLPVLLLALAPALAQAQEDPLKSAACGDALAALQAARAAGGAGVQASRANAARACLGGSGAPGRPARVLQVPVAVPPPVIAPAPQPLPIAQPAPIPPPVAIQRPPMPVHCDIGGCWSDDGTHLRQVGPNLAGPNGLCSQQGGVVYCP
jgi:outer membrane biosynthesis protein TonB